MSGTIGRFSYSITTPDADGGLPFKPWVVIDLKHWGDVSTDGSPVVSPKLMTEAEIDAHVAALKADLDKVRNNAKAALRHAEAKAER